MADAAEPAAVRIEGRIYHDRDGDGRQGRGEPGIAGVAVGDGRSIVRSGRDGGFALSTAPGRTVFAIKPAGWRAPDTDPAVPRFWLNLPPAAPQSLLYGGIAVGAMPTRFDLGLRPVPTRARDLNVVVFGDPQVKSPADVVYYGRDIVDSALADPALRGDGRADLGLSLGDVADDVLSLYPALNAETRRLSTPWLHAAGNHDLDFDVARDEDSLASFRNVYGPDTFAWEEREAVFVVLDNVIYRPGQKPLYVGGFREDQFAFLDAYLPTVDKRRLLVLAMHIPLFELDGRDAFRDADRERLFALLREFPNVLVLSAHSHTQRHHYHDARTGWRGAKPLHEYNVGAACGAFWSGAKDARGVPDTTMADGTPNGYAILRVNAEGGYALRWRVAGIGHEDPSAHVMHLHAPKALRRGAYPAWAVYANVYMGDDATRVEYRVGDGEWKAMTKVARPDPRLVAENVRDDLAERLRGFDRSPEADPSPHLWRGALPTDLAVGTHRIDVRVFDRWQGELRATTEYRLLQAEE